MFAGYQNASTRYPWLIPYIVSADLSLRSDDMFSAWVERASIIYNEFIESIAGKLG